MGNIGVNLTFFSNSELTNGELDCFDELCFNSYGSFWIQNSENKDLTKGSCYGYFQM